MRKIRCAIYTRKSSEEGVEQAFNSLDAQREACAAYIASQKHGAGCCCPTSMTMAGCRGATSDRPALRQLIEDLRQGRVDQIVVYKIDRLTRSLADFSKIVDTLDAAEASFVSVTQSFNTATSMGRLTLNMLLSFAQFEREVTAERIRDKTAASRRKGLWMGGNVPLGYDPEGRTLTVNAGEAATIETLYTLYEQTATVLAVKEQADRLGLRTRRRSKPDGIISGGGLLGVGHIHNLLTNPIYAGRIRHRDKVFDGQHRAIIDPVRWERIQQLLQENAAKTRARRTAPQRLLLCGKLFDETGDRLTPSHTMTRKGARLRYYVSHRLIKRSGAPNIDGWRLPAPELEEKVAHLLKAHLSKASFAGRLVPEADAAKIARWRSILEETCADSDVTRLLGLAARIDLHPGALGIQLDSKGRAACLSIAGDRIDTDTLLISAPFQLRKRGVETRLILGDAPAQRDDRLIRNIAKAHHWFAMIRSGKTLSEECQELCVSGHRPGSHLTAFTAAWA